MKRVRQGPRDGGQIDLATEFRRAVGNRRRDVGQVRHRAFAAKRAQRRAYIQTLDGPASLRHLGHLPESAELIELEPVAREGRAGRVEVVEVKVAVGLPAPPFALKLDAAQERSAGVQVVRGDLQ